MRLAPLDLRVVDDVLRAAVQEDVGSGDVTTAATIPESALATARYTPKQSLVVSGLSVVGRFLELIDSRLKYRTLAEDGNFAEKGAPVAEVHGSARSILTAERVTLNTLQRMCGDRKSTRLNSSH